MILGDASVLLIVYVCSPFGKKDGVGNIALSSVGIIAVAAFFFPKSVLRIHGDCSMSFVLRST